MAQTLKINTQHVAELLPSLTPRMTTKERFRFNLAAQDALDLLAAAYAAQVRDRGGKTDFRPDICDNLAELAEALSCASPKLGIICCGQPGNGKTTLLYAFRRLLNHLRMSGHFRHLAEDNPWFRPAIEIYAAKDIADISRAAPEEYSRIRNIPMLGIDDLGEEPAEALAYGNAITPVIDLLEHRYNRQLFTFITTNLTPAQIKQKYGLRLADRFNEMLHKIIFRGPTFRT